MSLNWNWSDKIGELEYTDRENRKFIVNIYEGNALMIFIYEYIQNEANMYSMFSFFCDQEHLNNLLKDDTYFDGWNKITLYKMNPKLLKAIKGLYKKGIDISFKNIPKKEFPPF